MDWIWIIQHQSNQQSYTRTLYSFKHSALKSAECACVCVRGATRTFGNIQSARSPRCPIKKMRHKKAPTMPCLEKPYTATGHTFCRTYPRTGDSSGSRNNSCSTLDPARPARRCNTSHLGGDTSLFFALETLNSLRIKLEDSHRS